jgi:cytochrome c oxidase subunit 2
MKKDLIVFGQLWLLLSIIGVVLVWQVDLLPVARSDKGVEIDHAFRVLLVMSMPVFAMVIAVLVYSVARSASFSLPPEDGMPLQGRGAFPIAWLVATSALAGVVMAFGIIETPKVMGHAHHADIVVNVKGVQWTWLVSYPDEGVASAREIVLPVDRVVKFNVSSSDVLHSFWIPAFQMKIDAVPGTDTGFTLKPISTGTMADDIGLRAQCAELCGLSHSRMRVPVRVVSDAEYEQWVASVKAPPTPAAGSGPSQEITISAKNILFDESTLTVKSGSQVKLTFDNQDGGIPHNWAVYKDKATAEANGAPIAGSPIESGPIKQEIVFAAPEPGEYFFRCDVHPTTMVGTLVVQ